MFSQNKQSVLLKAFKHVQHGHADVEICDGIDLFCFCG
jgi:hypothetical protein